MAGYSGTPLEKKLGVKDSHVVFLDKPPAGFALEAPTITRLPQKADLTLTFHTTRRTLEVRLPTLVGHTTPAGMIWVCWPKQVAVKAGRITSDLDENAVRELGLAAGVVDVKVCAIDEVWSGLKFVRRLADRVEC
jgi:hypothetical protein